MAGENLRDHGGIFYEFMRHQQCFQFGGRDLRSHKRPPIHHQILTKILASVCSERRTCSSKYKYWVFAIARQERNEISKVGYLEPLEFDDLLYSVDNKHLLIFVDEGDVTRVQPPVLVDRVGRCLRIIQVTCHDDPTWNIWFWKKL